MIQRLGKLIRHPHVRFYGLAGAAGSGKGTKASVVSKLINEIGLTPAYVCTSSVIRHHSKQDTELGQKLRDADQIMQSGGMAPDDPVIEAISTELHSLFENGFRIFFKDGFPRTIGQAKQALQIDKLSLIEFEIDLATSLKRARLRREQALDQGLKPRDDDEPSVVIKRYQVYQQVTKPGIRVIKDYCPKRVVTVQATDPIRAQIVKMLRSMHLDEEQIRNAISYLDNPNHPATKIITEIEGSVTHRRNHRPELQLVGIN